MFLLKELWGFLSTRKRFWLLPIILLMLVISIAIILGEGSAIAPLIYTLF
jgi:hypothetical protein